MKNRAQTLASRAATVRLIRGGRFRVFLFPVLDSEHPMKRYVCAWSLAALWIVSALLGMESLAQEKAKEKKKPNPPLPDYVRQVLTAEQEKDARKITDEYEADLDKLRVEIRKLNAELQKIVKERDGKIEALLTDQQKARVKELFAAAKAKIEANKKAKASVKPKATSSDKEPAKEKAAGQQ
jgi:hypothetical protein